MRLSLYANTAACIIILMWCSIFAYRHDQTLTTTPKVADSMTEVEEDLALMEKEIHLGKHRFRQLWQEQVRIAAEQDDIAQPAQVFNITLYTLREQTQRLRQEINRSIGSLNDFMACINACYLAHRTTDSGEAVPEANLRYFCNHNCMVAFELHHATDSSLNTTSDGTAATTTPNPQPTITTNGPVAGVGLVG